MKVRTLKMFNDLQTEKLRKVNEIFEVTQKRASELNAGPHGVLVEVIDEPKKRVTQKKKGD